MERKVDAIGILEVDVYKLLDECVDRGVDYGYTRAHKHTDNPDEFILKEQIKQYVMLEISERFKFD